MAEHVLKTWPRFFAALLDGSKTFEARKNDRNFQVGDWLNLHEWNPDTGQYTGRALAFRVTYILHGQGAFGVEPGHIVMALESDALTREREARVGLESQLAAKDAEVSGLRSDVDALNRTCIEGQAREADLVAQLAALRGAGAERDRDTWQCAIDECDVYLSQLSEGQGEIEGHEERAVAVEHLREVFRATRDSLPAATPPAGEATARDGYCLQPGDADCPDCAPVPWRAPAPVTSAPLNVGCQHNPEEDDIHACPTCVREGLGMAPVTSAREDGDAKFAAFMDAGLAQYLPDLATGAASKPEERSPFGNCGRCSRPLANYAGEPGACPRGVLNTEENDEACHRYCAESKANPAPADAGKPVGYCNRGGNHPEGLHSFSDTCRGWRLPGKNAPAAEQPASATASTSVREASDGRGPAAEGEGRTRGEDEARGEGADVPGVRTRGGAEANAASRGPADDVPVVPVRAANHGVAAEQPALVVCDEDSHPAKPHRAHNYAHVCLNPRPAKEEP